MEKLTVQSKAAAMWQAFDDDNKNLVRFGMFPAEAMLQAEAEGYPGKDLAVALMECADKDGGMVA